MQGLLEYGTRVPCSDASCSRAQGSSSRLTGVLGLERQKDWV